ncbi:unnamed protein product [Paramecium primaurelia]|uniref:Protein kinase domain-containing protein n=1 Tax=Paramecium primaurelia TaxID=5886 RepID=A0A8S1LCC5_PARPR|nr:unnamed protein product [Paramecium primaurelia]
MDQYKIVKRLGDGTYGCVYKATNINTGQTVAIKKFKKKYTSWDECVNLREVKALQKLKHPNIIKLVEVFKEKDELNLVFEYLDKDIYQQYLENQNNGKHLSEDKIRSVIKQVTEGLAYMHKVGYFHRDLKPENLLVSGETVKICDFGLAREIRSKPPYTDYVATRWYRAPEILLKSPNYNSPVDIFALGCIMAELYTLKPLFNGSSELDQLFKLCQTLGTPNIRDWPESQKLANAANITFPTYSPVQLEKVIPNASPEALELIRDMLKYDPQKRPSAKQILEYPYFTNHCFPMIQQIENKQEFPKIDRIERHEKHEDIFELPKVNNKENRNKMNESNSNFLDLLEQKMAEYDRPAKKELSIHKSSVKESKEFQPYKDYREQNLPMIQNNLPKDYLISKDHNQNDSLDPRIDSRNKKGQAGLKFLRHNDPIGEQLRNQQQLSIQQSRSYEPTKRNIYDFNLLQMPIAKPAFQPKLEMPKQNKNQMLGQNYPKSLPIAPNMGYKYQQQQQQQQYKFDDILYGKPPLKQYY